MASNIPIRDIVSSGTPSGTSLIVFDDGAMKKGTVASMADAVRPVASGSDATGGTDNVKVMTSLAVNQYVAGQIGATIASKAQGDIANTALQPAAIGVTVQAYDADLTAFAGKTAPTGAVVGTTDAQTLTNKTLTAPAITSPTGIVKGDVGLGNVDNTSDADKPVSTAMQTALNAKANTSSLATVATTGVYADLTGKPTLGTAAAAATTDFATAAQGAKADSAVQPGALGTLAVKNTIAVPADVTATGTPSSATALFGDGSWKPIPGGGDMLASNNLSDVASVSAARLNLGIHVPAGHIAGISLSNNSTDANNDLDFSDGECASDAVEPILMRHTAGTAQIDVAFGTGNGGRFDSVDSDGTWHCFVISDGVNVKRGFSKSLNPTSAPNYPSGYVHYRRVGSRFRVSSIFATVKEFGRGRIRRNMLSFPPASLNNVATVAARTNVPLRIPSGIPVVALFNASVASPSGGSLTVKFFDPDEADGAPSVTGAPGADLVCATITGVVNRAGDGYIERRSDGSGNISYRASVATGTILLMTLGWIDDLFPD